MTTPNEPAPQRIELTFAPGAGAELADAVRGIIERYAEIATVHGAPPAEPAAAGPDVEPWTFHDPRLKCEVIAFLDDRQQARFVPLVRVGEVPKGWRRLYVAAEG